MKESNLDVQETKDNIGDEVIINHNEERKWIKVIRNNANSPVLETETAEQE